MSVTKLVEALEVCKGILDWAQDNGAKNVPPVRKMVNAALRSAKKATMVYVVTRESECIASTVLIGVYQTEASAEQAIRLDIEETDNVREDYAIEPQPLQLID